MKNLIYSGIILTLLFSGCSSQKILQTEAPFVLGNVTAQKWVGGMEQTGTGYELKIPIPEILKDNVVLEEVFFRGRIAEITMENKQVAMAKYTSSKPDIIMHADPKEEVGNQPPSMDKKSKKKFPFELTSSEAVLSYNEDGKTKYFKIKKVKELAPKIFPAAKPRD
ncbi:hypothetical protein GGR42_001999 [Saonia flava]|uniref:Lipoprotein n=1 Tax=Saonia flava TaxID=523696 RepID=A0A846QWC8_9FLAO|nr:hypothetical protein [Saonia flava]NJB71537.1 hypothetical protein [Saonia flava]